MNFKIDDMSNGEDFIIGYDYIHRNSSKKHVFNPDKINNFHFSVSGASGSGKTLFLKQLIKYLKNRNKHIHVIDIKGDLEVDGENYIDFPIRNQKYGINPFEFDTNPETGGVKNRVGEIVDMIVKAFSLKIGSQKKDVISRLLMDTYSLAGITEDVETWGNELPRGEMLKRLPSLEDLVALSNRILDAVKYGHNSTLENALRKFGKNALESSKKIQMNEKTIHQIREKLKEKHSKNIDINDEDFEKKLDELITKDEEYAKIVKLIEDFEFEKNKINEAKTEFLKYSKKMFDIYIQSSCDEKKINFESFVAEDDLLTNIDLKYYSKKTVSDMLESISVYFEMLVNSGLFNKNLPNVQPGLNRYDISKHKQETQIFFTEVIAHKLFNATKRRGEYAQISKKIRDKRGEKNDTFLVIDEAQVILPDKASKEKESSSQIINRIVAESRSKGLGLVLSTQSLAKISDVVNINIPNKIIFKTLGNDINTVKKVINLTKEESEKIFKIINASFGLGLYIDESQKRNLFCAPWFNVANEKELCRL